MLLLLGDVHIPTWCTAHIDRDNLSLITIEFFLASFHSFILAFIFSSDYTVWSGLVACGALNFLVLGKVSLWHLLVPVLAGWNDVNYLWSTNYLLFFYLSSQYITYIIHFHADLKISMVEKWWGTALGENRRLSSCVLCSDNVWRIVWNVKKSEQKPEKTLKYAVA